MDYNRLAELLFPHINTTPEEMEARYPKRELPEGRKGNPYGPEPDRLHAPRQPVRRTGG